jgi:hypothetical protein
MQGFRFIGHNTPQLYEETSDIEFFVRNLPCDSLRTIWKGKKIAEESLAKESGMKWIESGLVRIALQPFFKFCPNFGNQKLIKPDIKTEAAPKQQKEGTSKLEAMQDVAQKFKTAPIRGIKDFAGF